MLLCSSVLCSRSLLLQPLREDFSAAELCAARQQQTETVFLLVAKTEKLIPSHSSNCRRGESESRLSSLRDVAEHDNDPARSQSFHNKTVGGHGGPQPAASRGQITGNKEKTSAQGLVCVAVSHVMEDLRRWTSVSQQKLKVCFYSCCLDSGTWTLVGCGQDQRFSSIQFICIVIIKSQQKSTVQKYSHTLTSQFVKFSI